MKAKIALICSVCFALALGAWFTAGYARAASPNNQNYWREFTYREYAFNIPAAWHTATGKDVNGYEAVIFTNRYNAYVGSIACYPYDGSPEDPFVDQNRTLKSGRTTYGVKLRIFYPDIAINRTHTSLILTMRDNSVEPNLEDNSPAQGCLLVVDNADYLVPLFRQIFQSVKIKPVANPAGQTFKDEDHNWSIDLPPGYVLRGDTVSDERNPDSPAPVMTIRFYSGMGEGPDLTGYKVLDANPVTLKDFGGVKLNVRCGTLGNQNVYLMKSGTSRWLIRPWECLNFQELDKSVMSLKRLR